MRTTPLRYRAYVYDSETWFYYLQSRYYDPELGRFINADALVSTGQGILGNNMFAYCNNNAVNMFDPNGQDPILLASVGGAIGAAIIRLFYASQNDLSVGETLLTLFGASIAGALGGAAGMLSEAAKASCVIGATIVSGLTSMYTEGSFVVGASLGFAGTFLGTTIDTSMYTGIDLVLANVITTLGTGYPAEMASQKIHDDFASMRKKLLPQKQITITGGGGGTAISRGMWNGAA